MKLIVEIAVETSGTVTKKAVREWVEKSLREEVDTPAEITRVRVRKVDRD